MWWHPGKSNGGASIRQVRKLRPRGEEHTQNFKVGLCRDVWHRSIRDGINRGRTGDEGGGCGEAGPQKGSMMWRGDEACITQPTCSPLGSLHMCVTAHPNTTCTRVSSWEPMSCRDWYKQIGLGGCRHLLETLQWTLSRPVEWPAALSLARGQSALSPPIPSPIQPQEGALAEDAKMMDEVREVPGLA